MRSSPGPSRAWTDLAPDYERARSAQDSLDRLVEIALTKRPYTMADLINVFSAAGLWIETAVEPQLSAEAARLYPHKQEWMNTYLGILMFTLLPREHR